jgi:prepilin-type N-terminal cleavage/methylation domain-containing protein
MKDDRNAVTRGRTGFATIVTVVTKGPNADLEQLRRHDYADTVRMKWNCSSRIALAAQTLVCTETGQNTVQFSRRHGFYGFTLIELIITVAIVAILASAALPLTQIAMQRGKERRYEPRCAKFARRSTPTSRRLMTVV